MRHVIGDVVIVRVCMELHLVHNEGYADKDEATNVIEIEGLVEHVTLHSAGCIVSHPKR